MSTQIAEVIPIETKEITVLTGGITIAEIKEMVEQFKTLKVIPGDKESYATVSKARMKFVHLRTDIDKNRKRLNDNAQKEIKTRNAEASDLLKIFSPAENHLTSEIEAEDARLKAIEDAKIQAEMERVNRIKGQIQMIKDLALSSTINMDSTMILKNRSAMQTAFDEFDFKEFKDEASNVLTVSMQAIDKTLSERLAWEEEEGKCKAEAERLAQVATEQKAAQDKIDAENKRQADERAKIEAEKKAIEDAKRNARLNALRCAGCYMPIDGQIYLTKEDSERFPRNPLDGAIISWDDNAFNKAIQEITEKIADINKAKEEDARLKAESTAKAKIEQEAKDKAEAEAKAFKEAEKKKQGEEAEKARAEALRPDKEKLLAWIKDFILPELILKSDEAAKIYNDAVDKIYAVLNDAQEEAETL